MKEFTIELVYDDDSSVFFNVSVDGSKHRQLALLSMITRGTLMASMAIQADCWNKDGFEVCSYVK